MTAPIVLIIFRRPAATRLVMNAIAQAKPKKLLVIADGPRDRPGEAEACRAARSVIDECVDWDCELLKHYSDINLGCGLRPATGITWAFQQVEEAIVLEDDCVPHPSFFTFCEELLERYRDDTRVMHIAGSTYRPQAIWTPYSYVFSRFNGAWGWATWRRAWRHFDQSVTLWPGLRDTSWLRDVLGNEQAVHHWAREFERAYRHAGDVTYWDHQWTFACWAHSGLSILPRVNLVSNVGCGPDGTHTLSQSDVRANLPANEMAFPLIHPPNVARHRDADWEFLRDIVLSGEQHVSRLHVIASRVAPRFLKRAYKVACSVLLSEGGSMYLGA